MQVYELGNTIYRMTTTLHPAYSIEYLIWEAMLNIDIFPAPTTRSIITQQRFYPRVEDEAVVALEHKWTTTFIVMIQ